MLLRDASFASRMVLRDRAKQADGYLSAPILIGAVGLRSEESLLFLSRLHFQEGERWQRNHPHHERAKRPARSAKPMPDSQLDLSDIPESTAAELRRARSGGL